LVAKAVAASDTQAAQFTAPQIGRGVEETARPFPPPLPASVLTCISRPCGPRRCTFRRSPDRPSKSPSHLGL
jgi:hypothetical protein